MSLSALAMKVGESNKENANRTINDEEINFFIKISFLLVFSKGKFLYTLGFIVRDYFQNFG